MMPCSDEKAIDLLNQLHFILESDPLIDEVGFVHPSQFVTLGGGDDDEYGNYFWNRDHKLGISSQILLPLYTAAKLAFMPAITQYNNNNNNTFDDSLETNIMKHSKALLLLSSDFATAWNSRKLIVSKKQEFLVFMDELLLSQLVLSYSPKSEQAWTHRRWVIRMIAGKCSTLEDIIAKESELVEKIAERSKMNYRAWNHRCWLVSYMSREQMLYELKKSKGWAGLHVADHSCYHYRRRPKWGRPSQHDNLHSHAEPATRTLVMLKGGGALIHSTTTNVGRRLMVGILESSNEEQEENSSYNNQVLKEELNWNQLLIKRYIGREALWLHRRFLSSYWIRHSTDNDEIDMFINSELSFVNSCSGIQDSEFEDFSAQATYSALYLLWLIKHVPQPQRVKLREKLEAEGNLNIVLKKKTFLFGLFDCGALDHLVYLT